MKKELRLAVGASFLLASVAGVFVACSDDPSNPPAEAGTEAGIDGGSDVQQQPETSPPVDGGVDANPDAPKPWPYKGRVDFDASCPIQDDPNANVGGATCNACVRTNCCAEMTNAIQGDIDGSVQLSDGGFTLAYQLWSCAFDNCAGVDAGNECYRINCESKFPAEAVKAARPMMDCMYGPIFNVPVADTCSSRPDTGTLLCSTQ